MLEKLKTHNESLVLMLFGIGWVFYALGIANFGKGFSTQTFFLVGVVLFFSFHFRAFSLKDLKILAIPLLCFIFVFILALLSVLDEVFPRSFSQVLKAANQNILGYVPLFFGLFLYARHTKSANIRKFFGVFMLFCALNVLATIFLLLQSGKTHNVPFFFTMLGEYNIWLLAPFALSLSAMIAFKDKKHKILGLLGLILVCIAIYSNGERSFIVAAVVMAFMPFIAWRYRHKLPIIIMALMLFGAGLVGFYHYSKNLSPRFNIANTIKHFFIVWDTPPALMGQFDKECFNEKAIWLECAPESLALGQNDITIEHSSLARINMTKSMLLAFLDEPFRPHIDVNNAGRYLYLYYLEKHPLNRSYITQTNIESGHYQTNGYWHQHNFWLSLAFSYGIIGFVAIVIFQAFLLFSAFKGIKSSDLIKQFLGLSLFIFTCGLMVQCTFDIIFTMILKCVFILQGALAGLCWREDSLNH